VNQIKKIQYNCRKATFLIEKKQLGNITLREKLELKIHLAGCSVCRIFEEQSIAINRMIRELFNAPEQKGISLDEEFKNDLQERIEKEMNNH
jgi:hypothetical protein